MNCLGKIVEPYLTPFRRIIPPIGGMLDISPIVALFALRFVAKGIDSDSAFNLLMKPDIYVHFHPDEKPFVDRASEWIERAAFAHELKRTDFLDPRQADILISLANRRPEVQVKLFGGYEGAERKRAIVAPDYRMLEDEPEGIALLEVRGSTQGHLELDHGDYLGAMLGLGIKRDRVGDLHIHDEFCSLSGG